MNDDEQVYGSYEPTAEDIAAIAEYVQTMAGVMTDPYGLSKVIDRAEGVFERYVEGFAPAVED